MSNGKTVSDKDKLLKKLKEKEKIEKLLDEFFNKHAKKLKKPAEFWRILKKRPGKQSVLLTKRQKPRQEPLDMKHGGKAKKKYGVVGKPTLRKGGKAK